MFDIEQMISWLWEGRIVWLVFTIVVTGGYCLYWYLFGQRTYRAANGKAQIKHGRLGKWGDLETHLETQHRR